MERRKPPKRATGRLELTQMHFCCSSNFRPKCFCLFKKHIWGFCSKWCSTNAGKKQQKGQRALQLCQILGKYPFNLLPKPSTCTTNSTFLISFLIPLQNEAFKLEKAQVRMPPTASRMPARLGVNSLLHLIHLEFQFAKRDFKSF